MLDYDSTSGRTSSSSAQLMIAYIKKQGLRVGWLLETHVHADHLSAAPYLLATQSRFFPSIRFQLTKE